MTHAGALPRPKPVLRGWLHAAMVPVTLVASWLLLRQVWPDGDGRWSVLLFTVCLVGLYTVSSVYHVPHWSRRARALLARCDGAMIQLFIVATFTPVAYHALSGAWRTWSLVAAWTVGIVGAAIAASRLQAPRWVAALGYVAVGWLAVVPFARMMTALPWEGSGLIVLGGVLYTVGAVVYARGWPDPFPRVFGYHEIFHLFVVAASTAHYLAIWQFVLPAAS